MAGIYIHIPFCKQACYYCDFHFSTSLRKKKDMIAAIIQEMKLRASEITEPIETIYFGGGTPSLLQDHEIMEIIETIHQLFHVIENPEITLEANPDDLSLERIIGLSQTPVNRLSIGIQSFFDEDLQLMNRAHSAQEALVSLRNAKLYFDNISIDLIYGIPEMSLERWKHNIEQALHLDIPHISSYALTVEPKTALATFIHNGTIPMPDDGLAHDHYIALVQTLTQQGYVHYEMSNFAKNTYFSRNNSAYWLGKKYLGVGPSAHSFDGKHRSWNISNNAIYIQKMADNILPQEVELLSVENRFNEYVMTGLRTIWGISLQKVENDFGDLFLQHLLRQAQPFVASNQLTIEDNVIKTTLKGAFFSDGIASDLFYV